MKTSLVLATLLALLLSACSAQPAPTSDPSVVQTSAAAAAQTMVAATQAAVPTNTPTPVPSPTTAPSPTAIVLPTLLSPDQAPTAAVPAAATQSGETNCVHPLDMGSAGPSHRTLIMNQTTATVNISLNLYKPNAFGQCGSISYANVTKGSNVMANLPSGYWFAYAWATGKGKNFTITGSFYVQPAVFDKLELCVRSSVLKYTPQC